jgi:nucleoside-diphosphate kinase
MEKTLMIIKPDAVKARHIGDILARVEQENFNISGLRFLELSRAQAESFYDIHKERPFFKDLVAYMTSGPVVVGRLEREHAVEKWREVIGATDPQKAAEGTIRKLYGTNIENNAVHGSDSPENGIRETDFFFQAGW